MRLRIDRSIPLADPVLRWALTAIGVAALVAARFFPFGALPPLCAFKTFTGLPCVSCGMTRSWVHVLHGRFGEAWQMSPLGAALCVATVAFLAYGGLRRLGMPAVRLDLRPLESIALRTAGVLLVLLNWGFVIHAGRA